MNKFDAEMLKSKAKFNSISENSEVKFEPEPDEIDSENEPTVKGLTIQKLKSYLDIFEEMSSIQIQLNAVYNSYHSPVFGSDSHGTTPSDPTVQSLHTAERLKNKLLNLQEEADELDELIDEIPNVVLRNVCRLHFASSLTWDETARQLKKNFTTGQSVRHYFYKYFVEDKEA